MSEQTHPPDSETEPDRQAIAARFAILKVKIWPTYLEKGGGKKLSDKETATLLPMVKWAIIEGVLRKPALLDESVRHLGTALIGTQPPHPIKLQRSLGLTQKKAEGMLFRAQRLMQLVDLELGKIDTEREKQEREERLLSDPRRVFKDSTTADTGSGTKPGPFLNDAADKGIDTSEQD